jgi:hypothetical protein
MPNLIKKVLANVAQVLTDVEKQRARDNIGIPKYVKLESYDPSISSLDDAARITDVGAFRILYYHDNGGSLRLMVENRDIGDLHSLVVSCGNGINSYANIAFGSRVDLSAVSFSVSNGTHQDMRFIIDGVNFGELSIQWYQSATPGASQLWYKG